MVNPEGPAQTLNYMLLGYTVVLICLAVLVISLAARYRRLSGELKRLQELEPQGEG